MNLPDFYCCLVKSVLLPCTVAISEFSNVSMKLNLIYLEMIKTRGSVEEHDS